MTANPQWRVLHMFCRVAVCLLSLVLIFATAIPLLRSDDWWIRIFDFPRIQIASLSGLALAGYAALRFVGRLRHWEHALAAAVGLGLVWQLYSIAPYTAHYPREMAQSQATDDSNSLSLLVYNVLVDSREVEPLLDLIREQDPDIILLTEPTQWWLEQLTSLEQKYPHTLLQPQENHYGLLLYSRMELVNPEVRFLIEENIPSLRTQVRLRSGTDVTLYGVHPRPPGLKRPEDEDAEGAAAQEGSDIEVGEREDSDMRDAELLLIAKEIKEMGDMPVIVAGDFNDVAWSHSTHLFQRIGGLLDPRVGRGLFNSYDTKSRFLRYPLDHVFASRHFLLRELKRLPDVGSDHFPILVVLDYDPDAGVVANDEPKEEAGDEEEAEEAIQEGKTDE